MVEVGKDQPRRTRAPCWEGDPIEGFQKVGLRIATLEMAQILVQGRKNKMPREKTQSGSLLGLLSSRQESLFGNAEFPMAMETS